MLKKRTLSLAGIFMILSTLALASDPVQDSGIDYGELYVLETRQELPSKVRVRTGYSYGVSNPFLHVHGIQISIQRELNSFFSIGFQPTYFITAPKDLTNVFDAYLKSEDADLIIEQPKYSLHTFIGVKPLSGFVNLFSLSTVALDLHLTFGVGVTRFNLASNWIPGISAAALPELMLTKKLGLFAGIEGYYDFFPGYFHNRVSLILGGIGRF